MYIHVHVYMHAYSLSALKQVWISFSVPMQCLQNLKADPLGLKPPREALAGLSAHNCDSAMKIVSSSINEKQYTICLSTG